MPVKVIEDGQEVIHIESTLGTHASLCGVDGYDPMLGFTGHSNSKQKITCEHCFQIWEACQKYSKKDFIF